MNEDACTFTITFTAKQRRALIDVLNAHGMDVGDLVPVLVPALREPGVFPQLMSLLEFGNVDGPKCSNPGEHGQTCCLRQRAA